MSITCPDCKGSGEYAPLVGPAEPCRLCKGVGELNDDDTAIDPKAKALDSVFNANLPGWMEDYKDEINLDDLRPKGGGIIFSPEECDRINGVTPELKVGSLIHVYDADWYEAEVVEIYQTVRPSNMNPVTMIRADYTCGSFRIPLLDPCCNDTQKRWEYIRSGTHIWP